MFPVGCQSSLHVCMFCVSLLLDSVKDIHLKNSLSPHSLASTTLWQNSRPLKWQRLKTGFGVFGRMVGVGEVCRGLSWAYQPSELDWCLALYLFSAGAGNHQASPAHPSPGPSTYPAKCPDHPTLPSTASVLSPQPSTANTESTPEPAPIQELTESTPEPAPFQELTESTPEPAPFQERTEHPLASAFPECTQECMLPEHLQVPAPRQRPPVLAPRQRPPVHERPQVVAPHERPPVPTPRQCPPVPAPRERPPMLTPRQRPPVHERPPPKCPLLMSTLQYPLLDSALQCPLLDTALHCPLQDCTLQCLSAPQECALPERPQEPVLPGHPQEHTPPTYQPDIAPTLPKDFFWGGGGSRTPVVEAGVAGLKADSPWLPESPDPPWSTESPDPPWPPKSPDPPWLPELVPP